MSSISDKINWADPSLLAPGDQSSREFNWTDLDIRRISDPKDPFFEKAYQALWNEFGDKGELEQREVLAQRMLWDPLMPQEQYSFGYELLGVFRGQELVAVRDHSVIIKIGEFPEAVVHLSHLLVNPPYRGTGLSGWLRAFPAITARTLLRGRLSSERCAITLVAEMEPFEASLSEKTHRLKSYQKAGFLMIDPKQLKYDQPDFRSFEEIDSSGGPSPIPLRLVIRRVGKEEEKLIRGTEVKRIVTSLYTMFEKTFRKKDMEVVWQRFQENGPANDLPVRLVLPLESSIK